ncbi:MAG: hypothetical protein JWP63_4836 [Candidatus Solibacter sp.]|nr:hypothetical protein [Candidatus Solibacter sp.]
MKHTEKLAPVAAVASAISCMACCLPLGIAAAAGSAGLGMVLEPFRPYLMAISGLLLVFGLWQLYRGGRTCRTRSRATLAIFWTSAVIVIVMFIAPQFLANLLADL